MIPKDPNMLYSYINVMLRDRYDTLQAIETARNIILRPSCLITC